MFYICACVVCVQLPVIWKEGKLFITLVEFKHNYLCFPNPEMRLMVVTVKDTLTLSTILYTKYVVVVLQIMNVYECNGTNILWGKRWYVPFNEAKPSWMEHFIFRLSLPLFLFLVYVLHLSLPPDLLPTYKSESNRPNKYSFKT